MSNTSSADSSILNYNDKVLWDFAKTTAYPVTIPQGSKSHVVYVYLSPYTADELKAVLSKAVSGYRREKRDVEIVREDRSIYTPLCDAHFIKLGNATGSVDAQKAWLDKNSELKPSIVEHTFGGLRMDTPESAEEQEDDDSMLDIALELSGQVKVYQELYDPATDKVVRVDMVHSHAHPTEQQFRQYRSARRSKYLRKSTLWTIAEQHSTLEKLYDTVVKSISGAAVDSKHCDESNKADWIGSVPLWHKLWIVDHIFGELVEKND